MGGIADELLEGCDAVTVKPDRVVGAEIHDEIGAVAARKNECIRTATADQHVVTAPAINGLAARSAGYDVVQLISEGITTISGYPQVFEIVGQGITHPGVDGVDTLPGIFDGTVDTGIEVINIVARAARHCHIDGTVAPHGIIEASACQQRSGTRGGKKSGGIVAVVECVSKRIQYCPGH
ncbi:hypothetical protein D3C87_1186210 [compost metagenome]